MTVDELSAMIDECAGESVLHEAYAADPEQTRATLEKLVDDWNAGKDFDPAVYDLLMGRVVERDGDSTMQTGWLKQQAVSDLQALVIRQWISGLQRGAVVVLYKVLTDLGNGVCISKKGFRLMPLDIVEMWNSLQPDESLSGYFIREEPWPRVCGAFSNTHSPRLSAWISTQSAQCFSSSSSELLHSSGQRQ